eukprot:4950277-Pyramimonas_sp.AAC.1
MEASLALAEAAAPFDAQRLAEWRRAPDPALFSIGAPRAVSPQAVMEALGGCIAAFGVPAEHLNCIE